MFLDLLPHRIGRFVGRVPERVRDLRPMREVEGDVETRIGMKHTREQREEARHEVRVALREAPLLLELLQRDHDPNGLLERVDPDRVARPARADRERPVPAMRRSALDVDAEVPVARGDR